MRQQSLRDRSCAGRWSSRWGLPSGRSARGSGFGSGRTSLRRIGGLMRSPAVAFVQGAADTAAAAIEDVGVDHGGADVAVADELLDGPDVVAGLEEVGGERVAQSVAAGGLCDAGVAHGVLDRALHDGLVQVMTVVPPGVAVAVVAGGGKDP